MKHPGPYNLGSISRGYRIGLLGGSFDPPHSGHLHISLWALRVFQLNQVWWLISPRNPLKRHRPAPVEVRLSMAKRKFPHPRIVPTDLESRIGAKYSVETLGFLASRCTHAGLIWLMGADNLEDFHHWEKWKEIFETVPVGVLNRRGHRKSSTGSHAARTFHQFRVGSEFAAALPEMKPPAWTIVTHPLHDSSSSNIRQSGYWNGYR